jgi:ankyrin repeat protein
VAKYLLSKGAQVNWKSFHAGCLTKDIGVISMLIGSGASVNLTDERATSPLFLVVDSLECFKLLLSHGSDVNTTSSDGDTVWHYAARTGAESTISYLLAENTPNVNAKNNKGVTPIMEAAANGCLPLVRQLLRKKPILMHD